MPVPQREIKRTPLDATSQQPKQAHNGSETNTATTPDLGQNQVETTSTPKTLKITNLSGDLIVDPPDNAIVIHSVNCQGQWGSGVALALAKALPSAHQVYKNHCERHSPPMLLGTALLIPPQKGDYDLSPGSDGSLPPRRRRWVYCLFVSDGYGRTTKTKPGKARPGEIVKYTQKALEGVRDTLHMVQKREVVDWGGEPEKDQNELPNTDVIWVCKFNSGSFGVKWETTLKIIEDVFEAQYVGIWEGEMIVVSRG